MHFKAENLRIPKHPNPSSKFTGATAPQNKGCPRKNAPLFWGAVAPTNFELGLKVGGVLESSGSQL